MNTLNLRFNIRFTGNVVIFSLEWDADKTSPLPPLAVLVRLLCIADPLGVLWDARPRHDRTVHV